MDHPIPTIIPDPCKLAADSALECQVQGRVTLSTWGVGFGQKGMGTRLSGGTGGSKGNPWPPVLALLLCPSLSCCSPRAETHKLLSFSLHPQGTKGPVGCPPSPLPGHPQIHRDSPALIRGLPVPISSRHLLLSWRPGSYPPASLTLLPCPSISSFPPLPLRLHYSSSCPSTPHRGLGHKLPLRDTKAPLISAPTAPADTGSVPTPKTQE